MAGVDVPVLVIAFNRRDALGRLFDVLGKVQPSRIYFAVDGPRKGKDGEKEKVESVRAAVSWIDWPCEVRTFFQEENLGCKKGVFTAIDWLFSQEEEGIVLEDDCIPHPDFFPYCAQLLDKYRDDERVMTICGERTPLRGLKVPGNYSYAFSRYPLIWGWASWRRAWKSMDIDLRSWPEVVSTGLMRSAFREEDHYYWFWGQFERVHAGISRDNWDIQWVYNCLFNGGLSIIPEVNLVSNVGFGADSTHTAGTDDPRSAAPTADLKFPLRHPPFVASSPLVDDLIIRQGIGVGKRPRWRRLAKHVKLDLMHLAGKDVSTYDFRARSRGT